MNKVYFHRLFTFTILYERQTLQRNLPVALVNLRFATPNFKYTPVLSMHAFCSIMKYKFCFRLNAIISGAASDNPLSRLKKQEIVNPMNNKNMVHQWICSITNDHNIGRFRASDVLCKF